MWCKCLGITALACLTLTCVHAADTKPAQPDSFVPLGVTWSWERGETLAAQENKDIWTHVENRFASLRELNVNAIWFINTPKDVLGKLLQTCERFEIGAYVALNEIQYKKHLHEPFESYYQKMVPHVVALAGNSSALRGWVLDDEPSLAHLDNIEKLGAMFTAHDPGRPNLTVSIRQVTPTLARQTSLPIIVSDLYPFFGPRDPNGPNTPAKSQGWYRRGARELVEAGQTHNAVPWMMAQCFVEVWGPWEYDEQWHIIGLPGSYLHWRNVTSAEMRWQLWEAIRSGCRGLFIFNATAIPVRPGSANLPTPDVTWKNVLASQPYDLGPGGVFNPDGSMPPVARTMGQVYAAIKPYREVIARWTIDKPSPSTTEGVSKQRFIDPLTNDRYLVIVNDNLQTPRRVRVRSGKDGWIELAPGQGRIVLQ